MRVSLLVLMMILGLFTLNAFSEQKPLSLSSDQRIKTVAYSPDNVVPVMGNTFISSQIILGKDEAVVDIQSGDAAAWSIGVNKAMPNIINIKPTITRSNTDMTVSTVDKQNVRRQYYFHLVSVDQLKDKPVTFAIRFIYPNKQRVIRAAKLSQQQQHAFSKISQSRNPDTFNWDYRFHGCSEIVPQHVFDDGHFTYLQLRQQQPIPAIFAVDDTKGSESLVNFRREGDYLVILRTVLQLTLRSSDHCVASVFNHAAIVRKQKGELAYAS